ncbi:MarR family winged helix-turn-helix transcriptional regulator [Sphingomonas sp. TZW2008]|uniref:MarR family winged helix-turn-helix transcriptional regulator n=1 Tax=Sphingomonas sp. TZW2008 TaxID=1917973 RepID=UPI000A267509|nr:MarR family transcriptional regulator [Sphingomonas sp. TZW2008]
MTSILVPSPDLFLREDAIRGGMDLLFFANTRHLKRADEKLAELGLGRAHHRVLYFVQRKPGSPISGLQSILAITKQSLKRVTHDLIERGLIELQQGRVDRRQRLVHLTDSGAALERQLFAELHDNMAQAYAASGGDAVRGFWTVLQHLIGDEGRQQFSKVQSCK